ncbi:MAG TPA: YceI family protein [Candidatus Aquilonibacter sp.]|nr:YceI family protein [Candidatus Aquilonibacter sp.]
MDALPRVLLPCVLALASAAFSPASRAQDVVVTLDPAATKVEFTLGATLHTVHGTFQLESGQLRFDPATGKCGGSVILDATSGNTDNASRDKKMHGEILESAKFPQIVFTPIHVTGPISEVLAGKIAIPLQVTGVFRLHGQDHPMTIPVTVDSSSASGKPVQLQASSKFDVPFVQWGLKNPSTFLLHVSDTVNLEVHAAGRISAPPASR